MKCHDVLETDIVHLLIKFERLIGGWISACGIVGG